MLEVSAVRVWPRGVPRSAPCSPCAPLSCSHAKPRRKGIDTQNADVSTPAKLDDLDLNGHFMPGRPTRPWPTGRCSGVAAPLHWRRGGTQTSVSRSPRDAQPSPLLSHTRATWDGIAVITLKGYIMEGLQKNIQQLVEDLDVQVFRPLQVRARKVSCVPTDCM